MADKTDRSSVRQAESENRKSTESSRKQRTLVSGPLASPDTQPPLIDLDRVWVTIEGKPILRDLSLRLYQEDRLALCGPSGIGKSTLIRLIAGLLPASAGTVQVNGRVSLVFDDNKLYPTLKARENVELGVDWSRVNRAKRHDLAQRWISFFECDSFADQICSTLSAGQRKRIALARAMMKEPQILLLDETFHALDPILKDELISKLLDLQKEMHFALVFATHDLREPESLQARVMVMSQDGVQQIRPNNS